jgi:gliding motility-associated-like protein
MKKTTTVVAHLIVLLLSCHHFAISQANIKVKVVSVAVLNQVDSDGFLAGDSDFVLEYIATDNTMGYSNNNPVLFGFLGDFNHAFVNGNNGPWTRTSPSGDINPTDGIFFNHDYVCPSDIPTNIAIEWQGYENDAPTNYDLTGGTFSQLRTNAQNGNIAVPGSTGTVNQTFTASAGGQTYRIVLQVIRTDFGTIELEDNICDAPQLNLNTTYNYSWCPSATLESNEPHTGDVSANGSVWFRFVAPASGAVTITTDLGGTEFGTYFQVYHSADGSSCITGLEPLTANVIKDKFEYLSHHEFSDGTDLLGIDPEAEITLDACDPLAPFSYQKVIPGQTYYVQLTSDDGGTRGYYQVRVNALGGSGYNLEDIPCLSSQVNPGIVQISSAANSPITANLSFGCAYDGGNNFGETGAPHNSPNPNQYHAYDYNHVAVNNNSVNESVWLNFIAPNSGRMVFETDYQSSIYSESSALFGFDDRFAPGVPVDFSCANLEDLYATDGGLNGLLGGSVQSARIEARCLEPGYRYYGMVDPASNLTPISAQDIDTWLYDPSAVDPSTNPPDNDILCLAMANSLYEVPVTPAGTTPSFEAVAGTNVWACREYLAGEPAAHPNQVDRADQTVWHYFVAPPSGAVEMNLRAYIDLDTLRYSVYELLNGTDCYGGLNPATFTNDGTRNTPEITPLLQGSAGFSGTQESVCCLVPGQMYAIQLDGGSPGDEGQYIIEYIREVESDAGDVFVQLANLDTVTVVSADTAFICFGDSFEPGIMLDGIGQSTQDLPSCLTPGYVIHSVFPIPDPVANTGFTFIDSLQTTGGVFTNNTDGSGSFGNPLFNTIYYVSPMGDEPANWGDLTCISSTVEEGIPVVYLQPVVPVSNYDNALCQITFTASGGLAQYYGSSFTYTIADGGMNLVGTGSFTAGTNVVFDVPAAQVFTISVTDGACPYTFTIDATACANPCIVSPNLNYVNASICEGESIFLEGALQTAAGLYTDVFTGANGCDSTVYTTLSVLQPSEFEQVFTICDGGSVTVGTNVYTISGVYTDIFTAANGCDSTVTTTLFVESVLTSNQSVTICEGDSYTFNGTNYNVTGTYSANLTAVGGCDSIATLFLTVNPTVNGSVSQTICSGQTYTFGAQTVSTTGSYTQTLTNVNGCDSIVTLYLTVNPPLTGSESVSICQGQDYVFGTQTLSTSGTYSEMFTTSSGCDSLATLFLTVNPALAGSEAVTICAGQSYTFGTQVLNSSGTYSEPFTTSSGCDSTATLYLTVLPAISTSGTATICAGQSYNFGTQVLTEAGTYTENLQTASGCDSVATLYLFVDDAPEFFTDTTICLSESYQFGTQILSSGGVYNEVFQSASGCDSLVTLELSVIDCTVPFEISNMVTPNDDGQNDIWNISDYTQIAGCTVTIYNRWGQPVYTTNDYQNEWAGTKDNEPLPDGVYYYSIVCSDQEYKGTINLFRFKK